MNLQSKMCGNFISFSGWNNKRPALPLTKLYRSSAKHSHSSNSVIITFVSQAQSLINLNETCLFPFPASTHIQGILVCLKRCHRRLLPHAFHRTQALTLILSNRSGEIGFVFSHALGESEAHSALLRDC